ncbi:MAG TPA: 50S ribosomal protein L18 [Deltaproteobacteria bacterium]|nr:50S ribosomal protein L18 [Deltaproteobacteria bacterium]HOM29608.1 50S ribosomal protein L18 [Deltaproteobacteria bacterium]HPP81814.1 50S ribosomal protein L18 [Deltaproteobacteria bacterium]
MSKKTERQAWQLRKERIRKRITGTADRPRLSVYRGLRHIYTQIIDDENGVTLAAASTLSPEIKGKVKGANIAAARLVGELLAAKARDKGIDKVVFDRSGYRYHGRVKAVAEAAREGGLKF